MDEEKETNSGDECGGCGDGSERWISESEIPERQTAQGDSVERSEEEMESIEVAGVYFIVTNEWEIMSKYPPPKPGDPFLVPLEPWPVPPPLPSGQPPPRPKPPAGPASPTPPVPQEVYRSTQGKNGQ